MATVSSSNHTYKASVGDRLRTAFLKPADPASAKVSDNEKLSVPEMEAAVKSANDKERLFGLLAAPLAAGIGIAVINSLIANDPAALLKNGLVNKLHVSVSLYHELVLVFLGMSLLMLVASMLRKRLFMGILIALYGLAIFNLHYWGFGIPFIMCGAWLLVRCYRLQKDLNVATGGKSGSGSSQSRASGNPSLSGRANKRYTPPSRARRY